MSIVAQVISKKELRVREGIGFIDYFWESDIDAYFDLYEDPGRPKLVKKAQIRDGKKYLSFFADR